MSDPIPECKHTCRDKLACGHQCCKRHFSRDLPADPQKAQPPANLQMTAQAGRKAVHSTDKHVPSQLACAALLQVQGKSVLQSRKALPDSSSDADAKYHFFVYDIESTGFSPTGDRIVEIAVQDLASSLEYSTLVSCAPCRVHQGAYQTHGISTKQSHDHGLPFKLVASEVVQFISNSTKPGATAVLVAHNGNTFDNRMLTAEFKRCSMAVPQTWHWLDSLPVARHLLPQLKRHSQAELRAFFELPPPAVAHRAAADVAVLAEIIKGLAKVAGVDMQGLMTLACPRKCSGTFEAYQGLELKEHQDKKVLYMF